jgi:hypothetical protein
MSCMARKDDVSSWLPGRGLTGNLCVLSSPARAEISTQSFFITPEESCEPSGLLQLYGKNVWFSAIIHKNQSKRREYCSKSYGDVVHGLCSVFSSPTGDISTAKDKKALILGAHRPRSCKLNCFVALKGKSLEFFSFYKLVLCATSPEYTVSADYRPDGWSSSPKGLFSRPAVAPVTHGLNKSKWGKLGHLGNETAVLSPKCAENQCKIWCKSIWFNEKVKKLASLRAFSVS